MVEYTKLRLAWKAAADKDDSQAMIRIQESLLQHTGRYLKHLEFNPEEFLGNPQPINASASERLKLLDENDIRPLSRRFVRLGQHSESLPGLADSAVSRDAYTASLSLTSS